MSEVFRFSGELPTDVIFTNIVNVYDVVYLVAFVYKTHSLTISINQQTAFLIRDELRSRGYGEVEDDMTRLAGSVRMTHLETIIE